MNRAVSTLLLLGLVSPGLSLASACGSRLISGRIVGGADALYGRWPWQAAVNNRVGLICGGSLINEQWVLSAAHCFNEPSRPENYNISLGMHELGALNPHGFTAGVKRIIYHPQYTSTGDRGNIALVELMNPVNFTDYIQPICLPSESVTFPSGLECWVTGWGTQNFGGNITNPNTLQEVMLPLIDDKLCDQMYHINSSASNDTTIIQEEKICAGYEEGGQDSCQGDSGGPLVCEVNGTWIQAGVVSGGDGCGFPYRPGVYTLVSAYEMWIKTYIPDFTFGNVSIPPPLITVFHPIISNLSQSPPAPVCGVPVISSRIVGGTDSVDGEWPWQVSILYRASHSCGGSLISNQWILSAAHCFASDPEPGNYYVILGAYQLSVPNSHWQPMVVEEIIMNPQYHSIGDRGDIALVKLNYQTNYTDYIQPICLPAASITFPCGMECWVTGWGNVNTGEDLLYPKTLQGVKIPLMDYKRCDQMYHVGSWVSNDITIIQEEKICAGYTEGGKDSCQGDSGGPLLCKVDGMWIQAGIVSWGEGCALAYRPGVYTLLPAYQSWIASYIPDLEFIDISYIPEPSPPCEAVNVPAEPDGGLSLFSASWKIIIFCLLVLCQS